MRRILALSGKDRETFLQGLVTNDVRRAPVWAALLTPQGKYLADFLIVPDGERLLIDVDEALAGDLIRRLSMYKLRADVTLEPTDLGLARGTGPAPEGAIADPRDPAAQAAYRASIAYAADTLAPHGIDLLLEPINGKDMPGYFLDCFDLAGQIIDEIDVPNLGLQFDVYQAHMIHGDVIDTWHRHARNVRHIQIAGCPGRHEPRAGEIDYAGFFRAVDAAGFSGWVGAEYTPRTSTEAGLRWLRSA